ncbi:ATP-binding protein [Deinococcus detaillensis]|uniref:ATP-binding protein n=1 Tax=Deinococcus detaillensis TaxID=2592048 RepID=A0A553US99_9DEIO|nr:ATP-binding protein [Deinococcus detaillensis]TSA83035.1 ATP-binding protein [Deinococcus detaillensis]
MKGEGPPAIHALHGFLGSGKTTLARQLETELPALRFSSDEWMVTLYGQDPPEALFSEYRSRIYALMRRYWTRALALGLPVVLDEGFWTRRERDDLRAEAEQLGVPLILYALSTPESVARERIRHRNQEPHSLYIAENTYNLFRPRFEPLEPDEPHILV